MRKFTLCKFQQCSLSVRILAVFDAKGVKAYNSNSTNLVQFDWSRANLKPFSYPAVSGTSVRPSVRFTFPGDNLSKQQWIFTKLGTCIDIVEIWFVIANWQISSNFNAVICPRHAHIFVSG